LLAVLRECRIVDAPFTLVEWPVEQATLHERHHTETASGAAMAARHEQDGTSGSRSGAAGGADHDVPSRLVRRRFRAIVAFTAGWLLNCVLSVIAVAYRQPIVGAATVALSVLLLVASTIVIAIHRCRRGATGRDWRGWQGEAPGAGQLGAKPPDG
jgi:hypothetical protein